MNLIFTVEDTVAACSAKVQKAAIQRVTFAEHGNLSVSAALGTMPLSAARQQQCLQDPQALQPVTREYRIGYLFDGEHFELSPASAASARRFGN